MPYLNYDSKEFVFKLVYYGPGLSGKTTNLIHIHNVLADKARGPLITLDTDEERTLFFDFLPLDIGEIQGFSIRFHMYTVPGQVYYEASRRLILEDADGVAFIADSTPERLEENILAYRMMEENLRSYDVDPKTFPIALQYNKRDCSDPINVGILEQELELGMLPRIEAVATEGSGVMETVRELSKLVISRFEL
jgi:mutual gliding-motility protein MglA